MKFDWYRLFRPWFWIQNDPTNWAWDAALRQALKTQEITAVGPYTCRIGQTEVWIASYPFAYGHPYQPRDEGLPSASTRALLRKKVRNSQQAYMNENVAKAIEGLKK